jgi:pimeloyl-ACP methyl ester carboxylesterase
MTAPVRASSPARSALLGTPNEVRLRSGTIRYFERGPEDAPAIVFVHGVLVNANLWRNVVDRLADSFRCITPDWPLGSHELPMSPDADLTPPGVARLVGDFLDELDLSDVTVVGNDTGGAICQILVTTRPERVGRLVLTPCDCYDIFLPRMFRYLELSARVPGATLALGQTMRLRPLRRLPIAFGWLAKRPIERQASDSYVLPGLQDGAIRRDARKVLRSTSPRLTLAAAERFRTFGRPVLVAWAREDKLFPVSYGRRLAAAFPRGRLVLIGDSFTFVPEDQPDRLADLIRSFVLEHQAA